VGPVIIIHIAIASISLFACILQLFVSFRKERDLLFLVCAVLSIVIFISFGFSILFSSAYTVSVSPFQIFRYQLLFTQAIFLCMLGVIFHMLNDGRKLYILLNSSLFYILIAFSILAPDYVMFGETATTHRFSLPSGDNILMINSGFTIWRALVDLTILLFIVSAWLLISRNLNYLSFKTRVALFTGLGLLFVGGLFDQAVDLGRIQSAYILPLAGFTYYMILSFIPFLKFVQVSSFQFEIIDRDEKWQSLIHKTDLLVVGLNRMGQVEFLSPYFYELTGFKEEEVIGKDWFEFIIPPKAHYDVQGTFVEILAYEFHPHYVNPILTKNNEERMIRWFNVRTRDKAGVITGSLSIGVDVSDEVKEKDSIRKKLKEAENLIIELNEKMIKH
jgi:PAS domain S-box-containing protein